METIKTQSGLQLPQPFTRDIHLRPADVAGAEQDLAVNIGDVNCVIVNDRDFAHAGGGELLHERAAQAPGTDDEDVRAVQRFLLGNTEARKQGLPGDALELFAGQLAQKVRSKCVSGA